MAYGINKQNLCAYLIVNGVFCLASPDQKILRYYFINLKFILMILRILRYFSANTDIYTAHWIPSYIQTRLIEQVEIIYHKYAKQIKN